MELGDIDMKFNGYNYEMNKIYSEVVSEHKFKNESEYEEFMRKERQEEWTERFG